MLALVQTSQFRKDYKRLVKQGKDMSLMKPVIETLQNQRPWTRNTLTTRWQAIGRVFGNATSRETGFWCTERMTGN